MFWGGFAGVLYKCKNFLEWKKKDIHLENFKLALPLHKINIRNSRLQDKFWRTIKKR